MTYLPMEEWTLLEGLVGRRYILTKIPNSMSIPGMDPFDDGFFVNIAETALVLQENYPAFREVAGFDFDPFGQVLDFSNPESLFWKKVLKNKMLLGILLGYGKRNAYLFDRFVRAGEDDAFAGFSCCRRVDLAGGPWRHVHRCVGASRCRRRAERLLARHYRGENQ